MPPANKLLLWLAFLALAALVASFAPQDPAPVAPAGHEAAVFGEDGGWCWFSDPRAIRIGGARDRTLAGWVSSEGDVVAGVVDATGALVESSVLHPRFQKDDHDNPVFLRRADGRILGFFMHHGGRDMFLRTTEEPDSIAAWTPARALPLHVPPEGGALPRGTSITYAHPVRLTAEGDRIWLFWRGLAWKPTVSWSDDGGETWEPGRILFARPGAEAGNRPYTKVASDGERRIHFALTDGHPRVEPTNSIYYFAWEDGAFRRADGSRLASLDELPIDPAEVDVVYDGEAEQVRAWIWDVAEDAEGRPVLVYARLPEETRHVYRYARWNGRRWVDRRICEAGGWFPETPPGKSEPEPHYSGGLSLDHDDPSVVYLSRSVGGVFEIERWTTPDGGDTWSSIPITSGSKKNNVRPVVVRDHSRGAGPTVLWVHADGGYEHYTRYRTSIRQAR